MTTVKAFAAKEAGAALEPFEFKLEGDLKATEIDIQVENCGVCHSDLSMINNEWGFSAYPFVGGHEVIGKVAAIGSAVTNHKIGDRVGLGWFCDYCATCNDCLAGNHTMCNDGQLTIGGRHGGFADRVRCGAIAAIPIPEGVAPESAGPLLCAGNTVFTPLVSYGIKGNAKVGVVGIGGLGHLAIKFYKAWGCHVTAFTSTPKFAEATAMGADRVVNSREEKEINALANQFDFILYTANQEGPWDAYVNALTFRGRLNFVGIPPKVSASVFGLLGEKSISGSGQSNPSRMLDMLKFAAKHKIEPTVEVFPFEEINKAFDKLKDGSVRFRAVVKW